MKQPYGKVYFALHKDLCVLDREGLKCAEDPTGSGENHWPKKVSLVNDTWGYSALPKPKQEIAQWAAGGQSKNYIMLSVYFHYVVMEVKWVYATAKLPSGG